ncbi:MAG: hypothetical protein JNL05_04910 [Flavobacteriales bacterium]|nr:hypothetical protein [Flavobacteriales bacterium]
MNPSTDPMTKQFLFLGVAAGMAALSGCHKNADGPEGISAVREMIAQNRTAAEQQFSVNASTGGQLFGAHGTVVTILPNAFRNHNGGNVNGTVTVKLVEAYDVSDMVWLNMRTVAVNGPNRIALQSGGEVALRAEANGQQVTVAAGAALVHFPAQQFDPLMRAFLAEEDEEGDLLWEDVGELDQDTGLAMLDSIGGGGGWMPGNFYTEPWPANTFGNSDWPDFAFMNCDHPLPPGGDSTDVTILLPQGMNDWSTSVWVVLPSINCMVYMEQYTNNGVKAGMPVRIGLQGTVVALRIENGQYYSSFTPITITDGIQQVITLQPTTQAQYQQDLQNL